MRSVLVITILSFLYTNNASSLTISEIMSNPVGDDAGREWVEVYNDQDVEIPFSSITISIKGGGAIAVTPLTGVSVPPKGYAIISSIISASSPTSRFLDSTLGYPSYTGSLARVVSSASFVNTGVTSLDLKLNGVITDSVSYTPAGEGKTLSKINGSFVQGTPTPGQDNQLAETESGTSKDQSSQQTTITQITPPSPDIVLYIPETMTVVAGAETEFSVYGMTKAGQSISDMTALWAFGDGGGAQGTTTTHTYAYTGTYIARVEAGNAHIRGSGTTQVRVILPEIFIKEYTTGKYGAYITITNPNEYDIDVSQWSIWINTNRYTFPKYTTLAKRNTTTITGRAMGFEKQTPKEGDSIKITFPNMEEVTHFVVQKATSSTVYEKKENISRVAFSEKKNTASQQTQKQDVLQKSSTTSNNLSKTRDKRLATWFKGMFQR